MIVTVYWPAEPGSRFSPDAFARNVGKLVPVTIEPIEAGTPASETTDPPPVEIIGGKVLKAVVDDDGAGITLTLDIPREHVNWSATPYELLRAVTETGTC